jgi:hypothetical protein
MTDLQRLILERTAPENRARYVAKWERLGQVPEGTLAAMGLEPPAPSEKPPRKSRGLGDTIAKITSALGVKPCGGCKKRQEALNRLVPYGDPPQNS